MTFYRTPAEMAADASYARSPVGESRSRHMLWLTEEDLAEAGPEPVRARQGRFDRSDPVQNLAESEHVKQWNAWWGRICSKVHVRQKEAFSDEKWLAEYHALLQQRRADGPVELAALEAEWDAYDKANPMRGLTDEEIATRTAVWERRGALVTEYHRIRRKTPESPRLEEILAEMRECERINDDLYNLSQTRTPLKQAA